MTAGFSLGQAANTRAAVLLSPGAWGQEQIILSGLDQVDSDVKRIGDLYARYEKSATASDWPGAVDALNPMTHDDVITRLGKLNDQQRDGVRRRRPATRPC